jgi:hypothetical protein
MALMYAGLSIAGGAFLLFSDRIPDLEGEDAIALKIQFAVLLVIGVPLAALFGIAPLLPKRRAAWIYGFVTIGIGMTSACCLPATIPLLLFWIKPETKQFFGGG